MNEITDLWKQFNTASKRLKEKLGRTSNLVGEYAIYLVNGYLNGELLTSPHADIQAPSGDLYQVKSRKISNGQTTQIGIIRSWNFDFLSIILFDDNGSVIKGLIYPRPIAEKYAVKNEYQNGWEISTTDEFLNDKIKLDITQEIRKLNKEPQANPKIETGRNLTIRPGSYENATNNINTSFPKKSGLKIGKYVQVTFNEIINKIDRNELENLQKQDYSKHVFDLQYPFLKKMQKGDKEKPLRYWKDPVKIMGEMYYMCSEWYEKEPNNDRPFYEKWLNKMRKK